ncbi:MAG: D-alanine--D-alanine ligase [Ignavibacteria bacterium]|nr:D-alanine--D-alanine ligase [Ignavibacteria bacterium]
MNIALITGGISAEREVSLSSGRSILKALRENGHSVIVVDPVYGAEKVPEETIFKDNVSQIYPDVHSLQDLRIKSYKNILSCFNSDIFDNIDIAFIGLHGKFGEDGRIQAILDSRGIKYTGSGVVSSVIAIDKDFSKIIFKQNGILTPDWFSLKKNDDINTVLLTEKINATFGLPLVVKPCDEGSTVGLTILYDFKGNSMEEAIRLAFKYSDKILIEKYIKGKEITVAVLDNLTYPVIEIRPKDGYYDYYHKYTPGMTEYICPAEISSETADNVKGTGLKAHRALDCEIYSRVDFILTDDNTAYCLEVNTLPGMTSLSLVPKSLKAAGIDFNKLIEQIINLSLNKYANN